MDVSPLPQSQPVARQPDPGREAALRATSEALEASFLAEMLKYTGVARPSESFGGGAGETAFSSFLTEAYATELSSAGGIGLAESIFEALLRREEAG